MRQLAHSAWLITAAVMFTLLAHSTSGQSVGINISGAAPHASALLDVDAAGLPANGKRALLIPRMSTAERIAIPTPATSLLVYDNTTTSFWFYDGAVWLEWADYLNTWKILGNTGLTAGTHFIGTTDALPVYLRANNNPAGILSLNVTSFGVRSSSAVLTNVTDHVTFGYEALPGAGTPAQDSNTAIGYRAMYPFANAQDNTAVGSEAMLNNLVAFGASQNTAVGYRALRDVDDQNATALGYRALESANTGFTTAAGSQALLASTAPFNVTAIGYQAGLNGGCGVGRGAAMGTSGFGFGVGACASSTAFNHGFGYNALNNVSTGYSNNAFGYNALSTLTTTNYNVAIGAQSLASTVGERNTAFGFSALDAATSGDYNTGLGALAGPTNGTLNYTTAIGYNSVPTATGRIVFGTTLSNNLTGGYGAWQNVSDARFKRDVRTDVPGIELIVALRPVTYRLDAPAIERFTGAAERLQRADAQAFAYHSAGWERAALVEHTGLLAQEAAATVDSLRVCMDLVHLPSTDQDHYSVGYATLVVPLVRAVQQQQDRIAVLRQANAALLSRLERLEFSSTEGICKTNTPAP